MSLITIHYFVLIIFQCKPLKWTINCISTNWLYFHLCICMSFLKNFLCRYTAISLCCCCCCCCRWSSDLINGSLDLTSWTNFMSRTTWVSDPTKTSLSTSYFPIQSTRLLVTLFRTLASTSVDLIICALCKAC